MKNCENVGKISVTVVNRGNFNKILLLCLTIYWGDFNEPLLLFWGIFAARGVVFSSGAC